MQELVVHVALVMAKVHLRCEGKEKEKKRIQQNRWEKEDFGHKGG